MSNSTAKILANNIFQCAFFAFGFQGFVTSVGSRDRRCRLALQSAMPPVIHSTLTSILTVIMLYTSPFEFIVRHFFWLLLAVMVIGVINGLFFFPIILSLIGPAAELVPLEYADRISTPSPPLHRHRRSSSSNNKTVVLNNRSSGRSSGGKHHQAKNINLNNEPSLTTITEEPQSWKSSSSSISTGPATTAIGGSNYNEYYHRNNCGGGVNNGGVGDQHHHHHHHHNNSGGGGGGHHSNNTHSGCHLGGTHTELKSIVVQPEVTVETTHNGTDQNTKVTATANIKVELVTPGRPATCQQYNS